MPSLHESKMGCGALLMSGMSFSSKKTTKEFYLKLENTIKDTAKKGKKHYRMITYVIANGQLTALDIKKNQQRDENPWFFIPAHPYFVAAFRPKKILEWENCIHGYNKNVMYAFKLTTSGLKKLKKLMMDNNIL